MHMRLLDPFLEQAKGKQAVHAALHWVAESARIGKALRMGTREWAAFCRGGGSIACEG